MLCAGISLCEDIRKKLTHFPLQGVKSGLNNIARSAFTNLSHKRPEACKYALESNYIPVCGTAICGGLLFGEKFLHSFLEYSFLSFQKNNQRHAEECRSVTTRETQVTSDSSGTRSSINFPVGKRVNTAVCR